MFFESKEPYRPIYAEQRPIDYAVQDATSWWQRSYVFMVKTRVKTWKGIIVIGLTAGVAIALIMSVSSENIWGK